MSLFSTPFPREYRTPLVARFDGRFKRCFNGAATAAVLFLIMVYVVPMPQPPAPSVEQVPERLAKLILEKPKPQVAQNTPTAHALEDEPAKVDEVKPESQPEPVVKPTPPARRAEPPKVAENQGQQGRQRAEEQVTQNLAQVTGSVDKVLDSIASALPASETATSTPRTPRRRAVRSGRGSGDVQQVGAASSGAAADVSGSGLSGSGPISIAEITDLSLDGESGSAGGSSSGGGAGELRSNQSLLAVVRRYAAGIQYCYDNELKANASLRGKLVVSLTVRSNGQVADAVVVEDTLKSASVRECVLSQIRGWKFPAIESGDVTFKTPFVFTPPQ